MSDGSLKEVPANNKFAEPFLEMASRISRNLETEFAGAILIVPPEGDPIAVMIADPSKSVEAFWAQAKQRIDVGMAEFLEARRGGNANWPGRR
jgi:hypothetical protein